VADSPSLRRICVFCGSSSGARAEYADAARTVGRSLARRGIGLVYGGGSVGLMGIVADAALESGGEVIGVIPKALATRELAHWGLSDLRVVGSMHERKALMADLSDAFVALPGGLGTFEEFCEVVTWAQLGLHAKPCALVSIAGYFDGFLELLDRAVAEGFVRPAHRGLVIAGGEPEAVIDALLASRPTPSAAPPGGDPR